jgi:hypothetical protein
MEKLNLPRFGHNIKHQEGKTVIFDVIRKKFVALTPEEWVRQNFVHYLINHLQYARSLINIETGLKYNQLAKRSDIIAYSRDSLPFLLVECKAPQVPINQSTFEQAAMYNKSVGAKYVVLTNGLEHSCFTFDQSSKQLKFLDHIPGFPE